MSKDKEKTVETIEQTDRSASDVKMGEDGRKVIHIDYKGVEFDFHPSTMEDQRVGYIIGKLNEKNLSVGDAALWQARMFDVILGSDAYEIMDAIAKACGGHFGESEFSEFFQYIMEVAQAKN